MDGYTIKDANFLRVISNIYIETYEKTQKSRDIIIFTTALQKTNNGILISGEGFLYKASDRFCIMYDAGLDRPAAYVHELGHVLGCEHSFVDIPDKWEQAKNKALSRINENNENIQAGDVDIVKYEEKISDANIKISTLKSKLELMKQSNSATAQKNIFTLNKNIETLNKNISKYKAAIANNKANNEIYKQRVLNAEKKLAELSSIKEKNPYRFFNQGTTSNFMDYSSNMNDFYKWQWMAMQEDVEKYYNKVDL
ncbi:hypothetical protein [Saccharicrinis fermentans]|uniref:Uncharacterized protein n=1 Tax=Saccharicrinis fermentans DSM 9555 = JCM 21142 TaxID=869213 RepID=W7YTX2_9BACT|nr:hypothetical protein [Saccharicrinis fermentans]GAF05894.1 hypothetical protein JCM21142_124653 [Saccharicrinis fermentans DSM 9555 = JCM 21142]